MSTLRISSSSSTNIKLTNNSESAAHDVDETSLNIDHSLLDRDNEVFDNDEMYINQKQEALIHVDQTLRRRRENHSARDRLKSQQNISNHNSKSQHTLSYESHPAETIAHQRQPSVQGEMLNTHPTIEAPMHFRHPSRDMSSSHASKSRTLPNRFQYPIMSAPYHHHMQANNSSDDRLNITTNGKSQLHHHHRERSHGLNHGSSYHPHTSDPLPEIGQLAHLSKHPLNGNHRDSHHHSHHHRQSSMTQSQRFGRLPQVVPDPEQLIYTDHEEPLALEDDLDRDLVFSKFFNSLSGLGQELPSATSSNAVGRTNYENVDSVQNDGPYMNQSENGQKYYQQSNIHNYYNVESVRNNLAMQDHDYPPPSPRRLTQVESANIKSNHTTSKSMSRRHRTPSTVIPPPMSMEKDANELLMLEICQNLGLPLDSAPEIPSSRQYTIVGDLKIGFPQLRRMKADWSDTKACIKLSQGDPIQVLGPSPGNRGLLSVQTEAGHCIDVPFRCTILEWPS